MPTADPQNAVDPPEAEPQVRITVGSRFESIDLIQIVVDDALERLGLDEDSRHWVGIAVREAVANAIKHGNGEDPDKLVDVELGVAGEVAVICVEDRGEGFEPDNVANPLAPENLLKPNGRGIFYMRRFMDEVSYRFRPDGGTVLMMRKRIGREVDRKGGANKEPKE